ncbi:MAG TPA: response regulator [Chthoniobacterales bacterium]|jgi:putative two-component system response regulator|nr:response regulator [Chthoniobacterales bacterium]
MNFEPEKTDERWLPNAALFSKMKIVAIDDEPANVALLEAMLADGGFTRVKTVTDSRLAMETCLAFEPDLVLLDLMMPHVDGFSILESLRAAAGESFLPVIVLTADANESTKLRALRAGATDFLLKPFDQLEVLLRMCNLLETRRLHLQLDTQLAAYADAVRDRTSELREAQLQLEKAEA